MKFSHKIVCVLSISLLMGWIVYSLLGVQIIKAIYEGRSASFLNNLIHGRDVHPVEFYLQMADRIIRRICVYAVILCLWGVLLVFMERSLETKAVFFGINLCLILIFMAEILLHFFKFLFKFFMLIFDVVPVIKFYDGTIIRQTNNFTALIIFHGYRHATYFKFFL